MITSIAPKHSFTYAGATVNVFHANQGEGLPRHEHAFSHATMCCSGSCIIRKENKELVIDKNSQPVNLVANEWHEIQALENDTVFINVFAEGKY